MYTVLHVLECLLVKKAGNWINRTTVGVLGAPSGRHELQNYTDASQVFAPTQRLLYFVETRTHIGKGSRCKNCCACNNLNDFIGKNYQSWLSDGTFN